MFLRPATRSKPKLHQPEQSRADHTARLVRVRFAARYLGISRKRVHNLILSGDLPSVQLKRGGNSPFLLDMRDLDRFIDGQKIGRL